MVEPRFQRGFTLQEAIEIAYNDDIEEIFIEPPDPTVLTDEDSGDEDGGGTMENLPGSQLRSQAEIKFANNERIGGPNQEDFQETVVLPELYGTSKATKKQSTQPIEWIIGDIEPRKRSFPAADYSAYKNLSPVELFENFFDDELVLYLQQECTKYALFKNETNPNISKEELKCFLAILILSGYNELPGKRFYWDSEQDMKNNLVSNSMRRDRFLQISRFIHCADNNNPDAADKIWKLRPLFDRIRSKCLQYFVPEESICYDESMIKYFGRHNCKQFIRGKPIRFGYKMWCLNNTDGYLINFELYQGNNPRRSEDYEKLFGKASEPLMRMLDEVMEIHGALPFHLHFDNLFTGVNLLKSLKERGCEGTGTVRENRIPRSCPMSSKKIMEKKTRGSFESIIDRTDGIIFVRWVDNGVVTAASTCYGVQPISSVRRYSQAEKKIVTVPRPNLISKYNSFMGGVDLMDENISRHRVGIRGKKWWWCLFTWSLDVCVHNAWQLHKKSGGSMTQLQFRREIVQTYLKRYGVAPKSPGKPSTSKGSTGRVLDDIRFDRLDHLVTHTQDKKKRRCAGKECTSIVRTMCVKCNVGLCVNCFFNFHTK